MLVLLIGVPALICSVQVYDRFAAMADMAPRWVNQGVIAELVVGIALVAWCWRCCNSPVTDVSLGLLRKFVGNFIGFLDYIRFNGIWKCANPGCVDGIARKSDCTILRDVASSSCTLASVPLRSLCLGQKPPLHVVRVSMQVAELLVKGCTKRLGVAGVQLKGNILGGLDEFPGRQWLRSTRKAFARENVQIAVRDHGYDDPWSKRFKIPNDYRPVSKGVFMKGGHPHDPVTIINSYACSHHLRSKEQVQVKLEDVFSCMLPEDPDIVYMVRECAPEPPCCTVLYDSMLRIDAVAMALERREIAEWAQKAEQFFKMLLGSDTWKQSS